MEFSHTPVLLKECLKGLNLKDGGIYADCTLGGAGHSLSILQSADCRLIGIDKDRDALESAKLRLKDYKDKVTLVKDDFKNIKNVLKDNGIEKVDGILIDLGVSSYQLDNPERGFSYMAHDAPLDMRMDKDQYLTAFNVVNEYSEGELIKIIRDYGEERYAPKIAYNIVRERQKQSIRTCGELVKIIDNSIPEFAKRTGGHPAKRTFMAIRIETNGELESLKESVYDCGDCLNKAGRLAIITFHSLEDRIVKHVFKDLENDCICDKRAPICVCNKKQEIKILTTKPIEADAFETDKNSRAKSAKLRICEKL